MELGLNVIVSLTFRVSASFWARISLKSESNQIAEGPMSGAKEKACLKTFHATMGVTRLEDWCVVGQGHRCHLGACLHVQLEAMQDAA
jgi:hypothetical protein